MVIDYSKQLELINAEEFTTPIHVVGCGAIGSWVVEILLKMGFQNIHVYDFDTVEEHNIPNQAFGERHIDMPKVEAMYDIYQSMTKDDRTRLTIHNEKILRPQAMLLNGIVFSCVDSMQVRKLLYENAYKKGIAEMFIEGRIGIWGAYVYSLYTKKDSEFENYEKTLYADEEAEVSACGVSQTALPAAINCASTMVMSMISRVRGNDIDNEVQYQLPDMVSMSSKWYE